MRYLQRHSIHSHDNFSQLNRLIPISWRLRFPWTSHLLWVASTVLNYCIYKRVASVCDEILDITSNMSFQTFGLKTQWNHLSTCYNKLLLSATLLSNTTDLGSFLSRFNVLPNQVKRSAAVFRFKARCLEHVITGGSTEGYISNILARPVLFYLYPGTGLTSLLIDFLWGLDFRTSFRSFRTVKNIWNFWAH